MEPKVLTIMEPQVPTMIQPKTMSMSDYISAAKRRKLSLILPALIVFLTAGIVALKLPSIYISTSTILIEEQTISADLVKSTVTGYAEQRLQNIYFRVMSFSKLLDLINRANLYPDLRKGWTNEKIVAKMREDINIEIIGSDAFGGRKRGRNAATTAFTLSYEGKDPVTVQNITSMLSYLFLDENIRAREKQAAGTTKFLEQEMDREKENLSELDAKMAKLEETHANELPTLLEVNTQSLNDIENTIERLNEQLRSLKEREGYLQAQLASVPRKFGEGKKDNTRLDELKAQLVHLRAQFSDQYPDVIKTRAEIAELEKQIAQAAIDNGQASGPLDNPAYITLAAQLSGIQVDIVSVKRQIKGANKRAGVFRLRLAATPKVEKAYKAIFNARKNTQAKYDDLMRKYTEAKLSHGIEKQQKGERFTLLDPARFPENPYKPNRMKIILIGFILGIGAGVGLTFLREITDHSIRDSESLVLATSFPVLASIPEIVTEEDIQQKKRKQIFIIIGAVLIGARCSVALHYLVMDLNVFWEKLMKKVTL